MAIRKADMRKILEQFLNLVRKGCDLAVILILGGGEVLMLCICHLRLSLRLVM